MQGYTGKILEIDLTNQKIVRKKSDRNWGKDFIGGFGVNAKLAFDRFEKGIGPLSPANTLIIGAGTLGGTLAPGSAKLSVTCKFPMTGSIGTAVGGMTLANHLKWAGYAHVVIRGRAAHPVYLRIFDERVSICDASDLWGNDIYETTDELRKRYGPDISVLAIGPAGENLVKVSLALIDKISTVGKGGLGAIIGSKNLKAIVARGTNGVSVADPDEFSHVLGRVWQRVHEFGPRKTWVELGMMRAWDYRSAGFLYSNWAHLYPKEKATERFGPEVYIQKAKKGRVACPSCPIAEKEVLEAKDGPFKGTVTYAGNFPGRVGNWGIRCGAESYDQVIKCQDMANRSGICAHSASNLIDFVISLFENRVITQKSTDGLELKRDFATTAILLEKIKTREGIGDIIANGYQGVAEAFGEEVRRDAQHIKFMDFQKDPRSGDLDSATFAQVTNPRGGRHQSGASFSSHMQSLEAMRRYGTRIGVPEKCFENIFDPLEGLNVGRMTRHCEDWYAVLTSLGICTLSQVNQFYDMETCAELYSSATGVRLDGQELKQAGERAWNLLKMINVIEGFSRKDDTFPSRWFEPLEIEGKKVYLQSYDRSRKLSHEDMERFLDTYYEERGWEVNEGIPTREKLVELGLEYTLQDLEEPALP